MRKLNDETGARAVGGRILHIAAGIAISATLLGGGASLAHEAHGHPARIHEGSCEDLGAVAYRLNGVGGSVDLDSAPVATPTAVNPDSAYQVLVSETTIDGTVDDLLASDHAVMVYESDEAMDAIACGNLGGAMDGDSLITGLAEAGVPGHLGFAIFEPDGERTVVTVIIGHAMAPVSASGGGGYAEGEDADREHGDEDAGHEVEQAEEAGHDAAATPAN
jgi:hypothetical protein